MKSFVPRSKTAVIVGAALSMMLATLFVAPPSADAQSVSFTRDLSIAQAATLGVSCNPIGTITEGGPLFDGQYCRPDGFLPVNNIVDCTDAASVFGLVFLFDDPTSTCYIDGYPGNGVSCEVPAVLLDGTSQMLSDGSPIAFVGCALPLLSDAATIMPPLPPVSMGGISFAAISAGTAACIDLSLIHI